MKLINSLSHTNGNLTSPEDGCWPTKRNSTGFLVLIVHYSTDILTIESLVGQIGVNPEIVKTKPNPRQALHAPSPHGKGPLGIDTGLPL